MELRVLNYFLAVAREEKHHKSGPISAYYAADAVEAACTSGGGIGRKAVPAQQPQYCFNSGWNDFKTAGAGNAIPCRKDEKRFAPSRGRLRASLRSEAVNLSPHIFIRTHQFISTKAPSRPI